MGDPKGLYRGALRPTNVDIAEFLGDIQDAFQGNSSGEPIDAFEARGDHYSFPKNVERMLKYLVTDGFVLDEFIEVLFPGAGELSSPDLRGRYNAFCSQVRDQSYENGLDLKLAPIAATAREVQCQADLAVGLADAQEGCLKESCNLACGFPLPCGSICGTQPIAASVAMSVPSSSRARWASVSRAAANAIRSAGCSPAITTLASRQSLSLGSAELRTSCAVSKT